MGRNRATIQGRYPFSGASLISGLVLLSLLLTWAAPPAQAVRGPVVAASSAAAFGGPGTVAAAKKKVKKPQATLTFTAAVGANGRLAVHFASNATKVTVRYKLGKKKKSVTLKVRAGSVDYVLPAKAKSPTAQTKATKKLRTSARLVLAATPPPATVPPPPATVPPPPATVPPPPATVPPPPAPTASVSISGAPTRVLLYESIQVTAVVDSPAAGTATLQLRSLTGWADVASQATGPGAVTLAFTAQDPGNLHLRVNFSAPGLNGATSAEVIVAVPAVGFQASVNPGTIELPAVTIQSVTGNPKSGQTVTLNPGSPALAVGNIIVSKMSARAPNGVLGRVTTITATGSSSIVTTTSTTIDDTYSDYHLAVGGTLAEMAPAAIRTLRQMGRDVAADNLRAAVHRGFRASCSASSPISEITFDTNFVKPIIDIRKSLQPVKRIRLEINPDLRIKLGFREGVSCRASFDALTLPIMAVDVPVGTVTLSPMVEVGVSGSLEVDLRVRGHAAIDWDGRTHTELSVAPSLTIGRPDGAGVELVLGFDLTIDLLTLAAVTGNLAAVLGAQAWTREGGGCFTKHTEMQAGITVSESVFKKEWNLVPKKRFLRTDFPEAHCTPPVAGGGATTPQPPPLPPRPPGPTAQTFTIVGAGSGAVARTGPYNGSPATRTLRDGTPVVINCQIAGDAVTYGGRPSVVWNNTSNGDYIPDVYFNTPAAWDFSSSVLPRCAGAPNPPGSGGSVGTGGNYKVTNTGGIGLRFHNATSMGAPVTRVLPEGAAVTVVCQVAGESVTAFGRPSIVWNKTDQGDYATDVYFNTPGAWDFSANLPRCSTTPPPPPPPPPATPSVSIERGAARTGGWYIRFNVYNGRANAKIGCQFSTSDGKYNGQWQRNVQLDGAGNGSSAPQEGTGTTWIWGFSGTISGNCDGISFSQGF